MDEPGTSFIRSTSSDSFETLRPVSSDRWSLVYNINGSFALINSAMNSPLPEVSKYSPEN